MNPGLVVKLRPVGPWRSGPDSGVRARVDVVYHSDSLYSAITWAMLSLGCMEDWLDATARAAAGSAVCFSSCFPFQDDISYVIPPRTLWPPMGGAPLNAPRVRWKSARFIPLSLIEPMIAGQPLNEEKWSYDGASECLIPAGKPGPFRTAVRNNAAVDRLSGSTDRHSTACIEFYPGAGLWTVVSFADEAALAAWGERVKAAFRLLADSGFGGERARGWGRAEAPEFVDGVLPDLVLPGGTSENYWLLSLFSPAADEAVDWQRGNYTVSSRAGRVLDTGELKRQLNMIVEGSVVCASSAPRGAAPDVAPEGAPHPAFRSGFALAIPLPEPQQAAPPQVSE